MRRLILEDFIEDRDRTLVDIDLLWRDVPMLCDDGDAEENTLEDLK